MSDYTPLKVANCYLYFTSKCVIEAFHVHADPQRRQATAAKFFVKADGTVIRTTQGNLTKAQVHQIQKYIEDNYRLMYDCWDAPLAA